MFTALILEDEEESRKLLQSYIMEDCPMLHLTASVANVADTVKLINETHPDIVFMDIQLQGETSFEVFDHLKEIDFEVIFITAYDRYSLKAIKLSAIDYLLKPISLVELQVAVAKAVQRRQEKITNKNLNTLLSNVKTAPENHQVAIATTEGYVFIKVSNIIYLESDGAYTYFHLRNNEKNITSKNLKEYEDLLSEYHFFRIHKSYVVNMREITRYIRGEGGSVVMSNGKTLDVSRRRKDEFLKLTNRL